MLRLFFIISICINVASTTNLPINIFADIFNINFPENSEKLNDEIKAEAMLETTQLIALNGYPAENHTTETSDGYILTIHRIPYGKNTNKSSQKTTNRVPILIFHGIGCSSAAWVDNLENSLGFILADEGYDVWLGNFRPNIAHKKYTPNDLKFWDFTADDYGLKDLPATIDYVLRATSSKKILYVGQSLGTTAIFQLLSTFTEFNDKIAGFVALNPVGGFAYMTLLPKYLANYDPLVWWVVPIGLGPQYFKLKKHLLGLIFDVCPASNSIFCAIMYGFVAGFETTYFNKIRFPIYIRHCSYVTSAKTIIQLAQNVHFRKFQKFDYGKKKNLKLYASELPPEYPLEKITTQAALFSTPNDPLGDPLDVAIVTRRLPNVVHKEIIPIAFFNHAELAELPLGKEITYDHVVKVLREMWNSHS